MSLKSSAEDGKPIPDTVTQLLQIAGRAYRDDPWDDSKERALASVIRAAVRAKWTARGIEDATGVDRFAIPGILLRWRQDQA